MKQNRISIITLTYNNLKKATKPFLEYLYSGEADFELIIVDNGSTDGTVEFLKDFEQSHNNVKVIYNSENLGFAKGCNQGIKLAQGEVIGLLNNDILFSSDWIKYPVEVLEKEQKAGFVSLSSVEAYAYSKRSFDGLTKKEIVELSYFPCVNPFFSCVFTQKRLFYKIGYFDEKFAPAYFEDDDISWRAIFAGYKNFKIDNVYFYHFGSVTGKNLNNLSEIFERNKKYFFTKYANNYFVECYWRLNSEAVSYKMKILKKRKRNIFYRLGLRKLKFN